MLATLRKFPKRNCKLYARGIRTASFVALALAAACIAPTIAGAQAAKVVGGGGAVTLTPNVNAAVTTYHNNNQRTGLNNSEVAFISEPTRP